MGSIGLNKQTGFVHCVPVNDQLVSCVLALFKEKNWFNLHIFQDDIKLIFNSLFNPYHIGIKYTFVSLGR